MLTVALLIFATLAFWSPALIAVQNITIDDQLGDGVTGQQVSYSPETGAWAQGATCTGCALKPDPDLTFDNTWHDSTYKGQSPGPFSFSLFFNGKSRGGFTELALINSHRRSYLCILYLSCWYTAR